MKLFSAPDANHFVFAVVPKNAKEGTAPTYVAIQGVDLETAEKQIDQRNHRPAYPFVMGRYDEKGRYMTYKPPIEGITPGRFVLHPMADEEFKASGWN